MTVPVKRLLGAALVAFGLGACATCEPGPNLGLYRKELKDWHSSGQYAACFAHAAGPGRVWIDRVIASKKPGDKMAVVFDIDETLLSNWAYLSQDDFNITYDSFKLWVRRHNDPALEPTKEIFERAKAAGIPIFLISGRHEAQRADTVRQLKAVGLVGWEALHLRPAEYVEKSIVPFKSGVRRQIASQGYRIVLNMGDQYSDLEGGYAEKHIKLPNPYYFIP
jgi:predicted secreted acid phosphatase